MKKLPIAVVSPHGGLAVPPELKERVALTEAQIFNEADAYVDDLFDFRDRVLHWTAFPYARAVIDVNRPPDVAKLPRPGDGVIKVQSSYGDPVFKPGMQPDAALEAELLARYFEPWHDQLAAIAADERVKLVIDAHSMAAYGPMLYGDPDNPRPRVMVGNMGTKDGRIRPDRGRLSAPFPLAMRLVKLLADRLADVEPIVAVGEETAVNNPFCGGWNLWAHGGIRQPWLMIEISRALYIGRQSGSSPIVPPDPVRNVAIRDYIWVAIEQLVAEL
ncbi:MAG: N-formylglutamate amidohydrolase [Anaerolineales bacterium]|nr:N-formylglutamate amidohydrolase [Anaerolineales bacterium]